MAVNGVSGSSTTGSAGSSASSSVGGMDTTFMSLLTAELQNQDPTSPMDSTQMVAQMLSLNQLTTLTQIRELLAGMSSTQAPASTSDTSTTGGKG